MASLKTKKKITQDELRRIMNEQKQKLAQTTRKIDSPLAKYTDDGKLHCIVCSHEVKSESVWIVHVNSKLHKDNIINARKKKETASTFAVPKPPPPVTTTVPKVLKRPTEEQEEDIPPKKIKGILTNAVSPKVPDDFFDNNNRDNNKTQNKQIIGKSSSLVDFSDSESDEEEVQEKPENFNKMDVTEEEISQPATAGSDSTLPEGFFDDPVMDAKARNVEYKNPGDDEWERFQKELKEVESQSAQMIAEDQEEATAERQILELDEQLRNWSRVRDMEVKKESVKVVGTSNNETSTNEDYTTSDEDEFSEYLDWRSKRS